MKNATALPLLALMLCGCTEGPFYQIVSLHSRGPKTEAILARVWQRPTDWFWHEADFERYQYFSAEISNGRIEHTRRLADTRWDEDAIFTPIAGTSDEFLQELIRAYDEHRIVLATVAPRQAAHLLDQTSTWERQLTKSAIATSRDGNHLLIVDDRGLRLIDVISGKVIQQTREDPLVDLHDAIVEQYGVAGTWWLSDDLSHVIIAPPESTYVGGAERTPEGIHIDTGQVELRTSQGAIYDRHRGSFVVFGQEVTTTPASRWIMFVRDAAVVDNEVWLLYGDGDTLLLATPDLSKTVFVKLPFHQNELFSLVSKNWRPAEHRIDVLECETPQELSIPRAGRSPSYAVHRWFYDSGKIDSSTISGAAVIRAIREAK